MKNYFSKKAFLLVFIILMIISTNVFAETLKVEKFYSKDPDDSEYFTYYDKMYGVLKLEISNAISSNKNEITVQNSTDIKVLEEANGARLIGYKISKEEMEECSSLIAEYGRCYYSNPEGELGYSIDNNRSAPSANPSYTTFISGTGTTITLMEEGYYYIYFGNGENQENEIEMLIEVKKESGGNIPKPLGDLKLKATPTSSKVLVDGKEISFDAYTIDGNNYFKLRDLATVVSETEKEFEVTWDGNKKAINLISNKTYTAVGSEMAKGDGEVKIPIVSASIIYKDGVQLKLIAYTIDENNYFKLRDIAEAFDIGITWDNNTKTIRIDTTSGYIAD